MSYFSVNLTPPVQPAIFPVHIPFFLYYCRVKLILYYKSAYTKSQKIKKNKNNSKHSYLPYVDNTLSVKLHNIIKAVDNLQLLLNLTKSNRQDQRHNSYL